MLLRLASLLKLRLTLLLSYHILLTTRALFDIFFFFLNADDETFAELLTELSKARNKTKQRY